MPNGSSWLLGCSQGGLDSRYEGCATHIIPPRSGKPLLGQHKVINVALFRHFYSCPLSNQENFILHPLRDSEMSLLPPYTTRELGRCPWAYVAQAHQPRFVLPPPLCSFPISTYKMAILKILLQTKPTWVIYNS